MFLYRFTSSLYFISWHPPIPSNHRVVGKPSTGLEPGRPCVPQAAQATRVDPRPTNSIRGIPNTRSRRHRSDVKTTTGVHFPPSLTCHFLCLPGMPESQRPCRPFRRPRASSASRPRSSTRREPSCHPRACPEIGKASRPSLSSPETSKPRSRSRFRFTSTRRRRLESGVTELLTM